MTTYTVTNGNDSGASSLRAAIALANANPGKDIIELAGEVELNSAIEITDSLSLIGSDNTVFSQAERNRLFKIDDGLADNKLRWQRENQDQKFEAATNSGSNCKCLENPRSPLSLRQGDCKSMVFAALRV
ncbi:MAG: hypothetical protein AAF298_13145 [Cyanobacteria bacterium P01_A01_bin.40]